MSAGDTLLRLVVVNQARKRHLGRFGIRPHHVSRARPVGSVAARSRAGAREGGLEWLKLLHATVVRPGAHIARQSGVSHARLHLQRASHSADVPHERSLLQTFFSRHAAHAGAASGMLMYAAKPPQLRPHCVSQFLARQALRAETGAELPVGTGLSMVHLDRQAGSPLHAPRQRSYGAQRSGSAAHADDSAQQFAPTHEAHALVPYGKPQTDGVRSAGRVVRDADELAAREGAAGRGERHDRRRSDRPGRVLLDDARRRVPRWPTTWRHEYGQEEAREYRESEPAVPEAEHRARLPCERQRGIAQAPSQV